MAEIHIEKLLVDEILGVKVETEALDLVALQKAMLLPFPITSATNRGTGELCLHVSARQYSDRQQIQPKYQRTDEGVQLMGIIAY